MGKRKQPRAHVVCGCPPPHSHCGRSQLGCRVEAQVRSGHSRWAARLLLGIRLRAQLEKHPGAEWGGKGREQLPWRHKGSPVLGALLQGEDTALPGVSPSFLGKNN